MISLLASIALSFQNPNAIEGVWMVESEDAYIKIFEDDGKFFGRVTWLKEPYDENGDPITDDDGNPIQDMVIMKDFIYEDGKWVDGTLYDAEEGKTYYGSMELDGREKLKLRGSLDSFGLIGRTETWTRMNQR